jgi:hypothetical protein
MKRRNFLSVLLALPFVRWFVPGHFVPGHFIQPSDFSAELFPGADGAQSRILLKQLLAKWNEEAISKGLDRDWCKRPFRLD